MSQAEELLATAAYSITRDAGAGINEEHIMIGRDRVVVIPESLQKIGVQFDHNIETVTFDCPRFWDKHDMSLMKIYVNYMRADGHVGMHLCDNIVAEDEIMHFDWTISGDVTAIEGYLTFLICVKKTDEEGNEAQHWNSMLNKDLFIAEGLECQETILAQYPDIVTQVLTRMDNVEIEQQRWETATEEDLAQWKSDVEKGYSDWTTANEQSMVNWKAVNEQSMTDWKLVTYAELDNRMKAAESHTTPEAIANQFNEVLETNETTREIVEETVNEFLYGDETVPTMVKNTIDAYLVENPPKVDVDETLSITGEAADAKAVGEALKNHDIITSTDYVLEDSIEGPLGLVELVGNSEQKQYIGKNLLPYPYLSTTNTVSGIAWTDNGDGTVTANGTNTEDAQNIFSCCSRVDTTQPLVLPAGTYIVSGSPQNGSGNLYYIQVGKTQDESYYDYGIDTGDGLTFTLEEETQIQIQLVVRTTEAVSNLTFKPMLRLASVEDDTWEPYVGGAPSPSANYPQEIESCDVTAIKATGGSNDEYIAYINLPEPLRKIGDVADRIVLQDGVWGVERKIGEVVLDGSDDESWRAVSTSRSTTTNIMQMGTPIVSDLISRSSTDLTNMLCTSYPIKTFNDTYDCIVGISISSGMLCIFGGGYTTSNVSNWKTTLQSNPVTVQYLLANPTFEPFDDISQAALSNLVTFAGVTYIDILSNLQPSSVKFNYPITEAGKLIIKAPIRHGELARDMSEMNETLSNDISAVATKLESISAIYVGTAEPDASNVIENAVYIRIIE